jgi:hypothetical protein
MAGGRVALGAEAAAELTEGSPHDRLLTNHKLIKKARTGRFSLPKDFM